VRPAAAHGFALGTLSALVACATLSTALGPGSEGDRIRFSHARHTAAKVECATCHEEVYDATALGTSHLPAEKKCLECHREQRETKNCAFCHSDVSGAKPWKTPAPTLKISHALHLEKVSDDCSRCHTGLPEPEGARAAPPPMSACAACHEHKEEIAEGRCATCHEDLTRFPLRPVSAFSHQGSFLKEHRLPAQASPQSCALCHAQAFCKDCHTQTSGARVERRLPERVDRALLHRGDFVARHALEARSDPALCQRCHGVSECQSCHEAQGLSPGSPTPVNPHPRGWMTPGPDSHGRAARRDIIACASCHDQGASSNCIDCHRVGGIGGNPHPPRFTLRHGPEEIDRNAMCLTCHR
jgi:hypothetical protein